MLSLSVSLMKELIDIDSICMYGGVIKEPNSVFRPPQSPIVDFFDFVERTSMMRQIICSI